MTNRTFTALSVMVLAAHVAALVADLKLKRGPLAVVALNIAVACVVLGYVALHPLRLRGPVDGQMIALVVLEVVVIVAALGPSRTGLASAFTWAGFGLHFAAALAAVAFALTFRVTRLF